MVAGASPRTHVRSPRLLQWEDGIPHCAAAASDRHQPGHASAAGAGGTAGRRQDHPGAAGPARCVVAGRAPDRDAGAAAGGRAQRGDVHGRPARRGGRPDGRLPDPLREQGVGAHPDRGGHRRHPDPDDPGRPGAGGHRRPAVGRVPRAPPGRRPGPGAGPGRAGRPARGPAYRGDVGDPGRAAPGRVPGRAAAVQRRSRPSGGDQPFPGAARGVTGSPGAACRRGGAGPASGRCAGVPARPARDRAGAGGAGSGRTS